MARAISFAGDGVASVALVLLIAHRGPGAVGLVLLAETLPYLLGPLAGSLADRFEQRALMIYSNLGQAVGFGVLALATPSLPVLFALVAATSLLATVFAPAGKSSIPQLVSKESLSRANALMSTASNLKLVAGPALGGVLAGLAGTRVAFAIDALTFVLSAALMLRLPTLRHPQSGNEGMWSGTAAGVRYTFNEPRTRALAVGTLVFVAFAAMDNVALVFLVRDSLHGSQTEYGVAVASFGVGLLLASIALSRYRGKRPAQQWLLIGVLVGALGAAGTGLAPVLALVMLGQVVAGASNTLDVVATDTLVQQLVADRMRGRVFGSIATAAQAGSALAYVAAAPLVAVAGARCAFLVAGGGMLIGLLAFIPLLRIPALVTDERV